MPSKAKRLLEDLNRTLPDGIPGMREERVVQDTIGPWLISTIKIKDHDYETMILNQTYNDGVPCPPSPLYSDTERGAWKNHNKCLKQVRKDMRPARRENREEKRIYPPYEYNNN